MRQPVCEEYYVTSMNLGSGYRVFGVLEYNGGNPVFTGSASELRACCGGVTDTPEAAAKLLLDIVVPSFERDRIAHVEFCKQLGLTAPYADQWDMFERQWEYYLTNRQNTGEPLPFPGGSVLFWRTMPYEVR